MKDTNGVNADVTGSMFILTILEQIKGTGLNSLKGT